MSHLGDLFDSSILSVSVSDRNDYSSEKLLKKLSENSGSSSVKRSVYGSNVTFSFLWGNTGCGGMDTFLRR